MDERHIKVLLVEDNPGDARLITELMKETQLAQFELKHVCQLSKALEELNKEEFDAILLDLSLPDSLGLDSLTHTIAHSPEKPIVVLTGNDDEILGIKAIEEGAQDYLIKGQVDGNLLGRSLCYSIERKRKEREIEEIFEKLQKTRWSSIYSMAKMVEARDPYTAGHQERVANLATPIAREMELSENEIEVIKMASTVHDIGKNHIPFEILNKSGPLTEMEFNFIKTHSLVGYNILSIIEFPWPFAEIVFQHHEKINGSGYPHGLEGENILKEARIIGVTDVIEAMVSHRPYRPALSIDKVINEITENRGILYDPAVVDTFMNLFNQGRISFSEGTHGNNFIIKDWS